MSTVSSTGSTSSSTTASPQQQTVPALPTQTLNQQDFLNLLVAQMSAQDPLDPISNTDFVAQMAQFSSLQASQGIEAGVAGMASQQQFLQATSLLGETVTLQNPDGSSAQGVVSAVSMQAGTPSIVVNGQSYGLSQVAGVSP